jgi:hypothetical protein
MADPVRSGERSMTVVCSWCSTEVAEGTATCPSCGANLVPDGDPNVPGVTAVDAASIIRSKTAPQPRSRLLSWISGEDFPDLPSKAEQQAIAPPDIEVRREILRLELEAEVANLQAEADALHAEAVAEGRTIDLPAGADLVTEDVGKGSPDAAGAADDETAAAASAEPASADAPGDSDKDTAAG